MGAPSECQNHLASLLVRMAVAWCALHFRARAHAQERAGEERRRSVEQLRRLLAQRRALAARAQRPYLWLFLGMPGRGAPKHVVSAVGVRLCVCAHVALRLFNCGVAVMASL